MVGRKDFFPIIIRFKCDLACVKRSVRSESVYGALSRVTSYREIR